MTPDVVTPPRVAQRSPSLAMAAVELRASRPWSRLPFALAALVVALHVVVNATGAYGIHRDEYLYLAMGEHVRLWAMDFPPMIALAAEAQRALLGDSLVALRTVPMLAAAALILLSAWTARAMGGGRGAQAIAALAVAANPLFLRAGHLFQPVILDQLAWTLALVALVQLCRTGDPRWWLAFGAACGVGLLVKFSIVFLGAGVLLALLATRHRRALLTRWPWIAVALVLVIGAPSVVGQLRLGWPVLGQMRDLQESQLVHVGWLDFALGQLMLGPAALLALAGVLASFRRGPMRRYALVTLSCAGAFLVLMLLRGKAYYLGPVYPVLFAAGAVWLQRVAGGGRRVAYLATPVLVLLFGLWTLPVGVPLLRPDAMRAYLTDAGLGESLRTNRDAMGALPQDYADMLGWEAMVDTVARVYRDLPPEERARAVLIGGNYGRAGALDLHGPARGLPKAICACGSYWFWGAGDRPGEVAIIVGGTPEELGQFFGEVREVARSGRGNAWLVEEERDFAIHVVRKPHRTLQQVWPMLAGRN